MESVLGIIVVLSIAGLLTPVLEVVWKRFTSKYLAPYIASIALVLALIINLYSIIQPGEIPYIFGNVHRIPNYLLKVQNQHILPLMLFLNKYQS